MATLVFYARGDNATANNGNLNVQNKTQVPTTQLTFEDYGGTGDLFLDAGGGLVDPNTQVLIGGQYYDFIVEQTGILPTGHGSVPDVLEGKEITVISVMLNGTTYQRYFFVTDGSGTSALMDDFGNGAIALIGTHVYICFCEDTDILTPTGYEKVQTLKSGDMVLTSSGDAVPILWIGQTAISLEDMERDPARQPVRIAANAVAPGVPHADLLVSAQHRVVLDGFWSECYFAESSVMVRAKHLVGTVAEWASPTADVAYFHILLDAHHMLVSNNLPTESFQPSLRSYNGMPQQSRDALLAEIPVAQLQAYFRRPDAMRTLKAHETAVLVKQMFGMATQTIGMPQGATA